MARLELALLGPFQVTVDGRPVTSFRSDKARALLAYLAVEAGRPHRREALAGLLWPDLSDQAARSNLRLSLHRLRQAIAGDAAAGALDITSETVQFNPAGAWLDVAAFNAHLSAVAEHAPRHRRVEACPVCVPNLRAAAGLYRGDLLEDLFVDDSTAFAEWLLMRREALRRRVQEALYILAEHHRGRGEAERAQHYAARQLELEPWREEAYRQLMSALALAGQRSAALAQYEACRRALARELHAEPSAETTALYERIRSAGPAGPGVRGLPSMPTPFVGRAAAAGSVVGLLADPDCRLLTLLGPGGIGKTRLAAHAAHHIARAFLHGAAFVPLGGLDQTGSLPAAIGGALGLSFAGKDDPETRLLNVLKDREILLVLDSLEHLLAGAGLLAKLLAAAPGLKLLVTSRERLALSEEWLFEVEGLTYPPRAEAEDLEAFEAVQLFVGCARRVEPRFTLSPEQAPHVAHICRVTEGMPLAIELAAAWVRSVPCGVIAREITHGLDRLATPLRDVPPRHRSVRAAFDHSWRRLAPAEQGVLRKLSVFRGGFDATGAGQVAGATAELLAALLDRSLIRRAPLAGDGARCDLHELVRQYAEEQLVSAGEVEAAREWHLEFCVALAEEAEGQLRGEAQASWLERLEREHDNLRAALDWSLKAGRLAAGLRLAGSLAEFWRYRGHLHEARRWFEALLAAAAPAGAPGAGQPLAPAAREAWAKAYRGAGDIAYDQGRLEAALAHYEASLRLSRSAEDPLGIAAALCDLGMVAWVRSDFAQAQAHCQASLDLYREAGDRHGLAEATRRLAMVLRLQGHYERAAEGYQTSLRLYRELGNRRGMAQALEGLGLVARVHDRDLEQAQALHAESLALRRALGDRHGSAYALINLGNVAHQRGDYAQARAYLEECLALRRELGDQVGLAAALNTLGDLSLDEDDPAEARRLFEAALALRRELGDRYSTVDDLRGLGQARARLGEAAPARACFEEALALAREVGTEALVAATLRDYADALRQAGDLAEARARALECLTLYRQQGNAGGVATGLETLAEITWAAGQPRRAAQLLAAAEAARRPPAAPAAPAERARLDRLRASLRAELSEAEFAAAWAEGQAQTPEQAVNSARAGA